MNWVVLFFYPLDIEGNPPRVFSCSAADREEAERRFFLEEPNCDMVWVHAGDDATHAKRDWAQQGRFNQF